MKVMDKKGYLRMLEAIIAVVIIFGAVLVMLPRKQIQQAEMPDEIDSTLRSVLEEAQNNEQFRTCLLLNNSVKLKIKENNQEVPKNNKECMYNLLKNALPIFTPWNFGFAICPRELANCAIYNGNEGSLQETTIGFDHLIEKIPATKSVYTKSIVISVPDILAKPFIVSENPFNGCCDSTIPTNTNGCELNNIKARCIPAEGKTIFIYIWER